MHPHTWLTTQGILPRALCFHWWNARRQVPAVCTAIVQPRPGDRRGVFPPLRITRRGLGSQMSLTCCFYLTVTGAEVGAQSASGGALP